MNIYIFKGVLQHLKFSLKLRFSAMMRIAMMMIRVVSKVYFSSGHLQRGEVRHEEDKQLVEMKSVQM